MTIAGSIFKACFVQPAMDVKVLRLNGEEVATVRLDAAADVKALKHAIAEIDGTPAILQQLIWKDQPLDDSVQAPLLAAQLDASAPVMLVKKDPGFRNTSPDNPMPLINEDTLKRNMRAPII